MSSSKKADPDIDVLNTGVVRAGDVSVLLVNVCVPDRVTTVASILKVTAVPLATELIPVPPNKPSVSLFILTSI